MQKAVALVFYVLLSYLLVAQDTLTYTPLYSSFFGGSDFEQARDLTVDREGNIYVTGGTSSPDFPVTSGAFMTTYNNAGSNTVGNWGPMMVFVSKFSPTGDLIWSTFLGGPNYDRAYAIEVDEEGFVYVGGRAGADFPTTTGAFQEDFIQQGGINGLYGHQNGFVAKLSPDGAELIWATYYGSDSFGFFRDIDIDEDGNVYGILNAVRRLPNGISADAFDTTLNGNFDMVPVKFSADGSSVIWATVLGGSGEDRGGPSIRVGPDQSVYVAGATQSTDWPVTSDAVQTQNAGQSDMFVTRLSPNGDSLIYSTYFGGSANEFSETHCLEVDELGHAYLAGGTMSIDLVTTPNAVKPTKTTNDGFDALLAKFSPDGTELLASTYYGGAGGDAAEGLFVDSLQRLYFGGGTHSQNLQVTPGAVQPQLAGDADGYFVRLSPQFDSVEYSTYWGGSSDEAVRAFHVSSGGSIACSGQTESIDLSVSPAAFQLMHANAGSEADSYLSVFELEEPTLVSTLDLVPMGPDFRIYPNPFQSEFSVELSGESSTPGQLRVYDPTGRQVLEQNIYPGKNAIHPRAWKAGVYVYHYINDREQLKTGVLLKM